MNPSLTIAVLDAVPEVYWADDLGNTDSQKFIDLLQPQNPEARFEVFYVSKNEFPESLDPFDAILLTGSPCSVHDAHAWIGRLIELVRVADARGLGIMGSCFGHQLIARAFGGEVGPNEQGWLIGNYRVHLSRSLDWMQPALPSTGLYHFNQERVTRLPPAAIAYAYTDLYPDYGYTIGDNILCFQGHPEQPHRAMMNFLNAMDSLSDEARATALQRINGEAPDASVWAEWMMRFFNNSRTVVRRSA